MNIAAISWLIDWAIQGFQVKYSIELDLGSADVPLLTKFNSQSNWTGASYPSKSWF